MADKAQRGFYLVTEAIRDELILNQGIKTATFGDISDIDLQKQTMFPLGHVIINNVTNLEKVLQFSFTVLTMEQIDSVNEYVDDLWTGNSNMQDILNTQLAVSNGLIAKLKRGQLYADGYELVGNPTCEPFFDRFENILAGWATTFTIQIFNDTSAC